MITISDDDDSDCVRNVENNCKLHSLDEAISYVSDNSVINITLPYALLLSRVSITNLSNIIITGHDFPEVDCKHTGALECINCSNITIKNIKWKRCGFFNISTNHNLSPLAGISFDSCNNVTIQCCKFITSLVQLSQVTGAVEIKHVHFSDNYTNT